MTGQVSLCTRGERALKPELGGYLSEECRKRDLSLRRLSVNAGLSPATVHNILKREYHPTLTSLNLLADYLGVRRQYLWYLAGLLNDMDYGSEVDVTDDRLKLLYNRANKLPLQSRTLIGNLMEAALAYSEAGGNGPAPETKVEQHLYAAEKESSFQHED